MSKSKLLDQVREKIRRLNYAYSTEKAYISWIKRFIIFNEKRHPSELGAVEIEVFLTHLAVEKKVSPSTQNQALAAQERRLTLRLGEGETERLWDYVRGRFKTASDK